MTPETLAYLRFSGLIRYAEIQDDGRTILPTTRRVPALLAWLRRPLRDLPETNGNVQPVPCADCPA